LNRDQIGKIARLTGCKNFEGKRKKFIFNAFADLKPMERFEDGNDMLGFRSLNNSTSKRVLDVLEPVKLIVWKVVIERVTVITFRMDNGGDNGAGCFEVEIWANTAKFRNVIVAGFRKCRDLVGEGKVFIKDKAKVESRVGCSERIVVYFGKLLFKSDKKKLSLRSVERPLPPISRSHHYLMLNISQTVRDTDIVSMEY